MFSVFFFFLSKKYSNEGLATPYVFCGTEASVYSGNLLEKQES